MADKQGDTPGENRNEDSDETTEIDSDVEPNTIQTEDKGGGANTKSSDITQAAHDGTAPPSGSKQNTTSQKAGVKQRLSDSSPQQTAVTPSKYQKHHLFPIRVGISWHVGARIEAMDFLEKWYPAKVTDIDEDELMVLIHFEGWNQRYDEWVPMASEKIRPLTRHSGRKEKTKGRLRSEHKIGDLVYAKWTDCRIYPAKITAINQDGSFEVLFYDGFNKTVQPINVRAMPAKKQAEMMKESEILSSKGFKSMKDAIKSNSTQDATTRRRSDSGSKKDQAVKTLPKKDPSVIRVKRIHKEMDSKRKRDRSKMALSAGNHDKKSDQTKSSIGFKLGKKRKLLVGGSFSFQSKRSRQEININKKSPDKKRKLEKVKEGSSSPTKKIKLGGSSPSKRHKTKERSQSSEVVTSVASDHETHSSDTVLAQPDVTSQLAPPSDHNSQHDNVPSVTLPKTSTAAKAVKKCARSRSDSSLMTSPVNQDTPSPAQAVSHAPQDAKKRDSSQEKASVAPKEFKVEDDHNHFKCPFDGCNKSFRKESLVEYHIKYYHAEDGRPIPPPQPRTRKKTTSICSNDSDISVTNVKPPKSAGKKKRGISAPSMLETSNDPIIPVLPPASKAQIATVEETVTDVTEGSAEGTVCTSLTDEHEQKDILLTEDSVDDLEEEMEGNKDEVVSCVCQYNEENGLMIQCDVCLCWQHAFCCNITEETLPSLKKYVCYVCQNPPGVRDSARFVYNQDWLRHGRLASFSFLPEQEESQNDAAQFLATNDLVSDMQNIKNVLASINQNVYVLQNPDDHASKIRVWNRNWDAESQQNLDDKNSITNLGIESMTSMLDESNQDVDIEEHINVVDVSVETGPEELSLAPMGQQIKIEGTPLRTSSSTQGVEASIGEHISLSNDQVKELNSSNSSEDSTMESEISKNQQTMESLDDSGNVIEVSSDAIDDTAASLSVENAESEQSKENALSEVKSESLPTTEQDNHTGVTAGGSEQNHSAQKSVSQKPDLTFSDSTTDTASESELQITPPSKIQQRSSSSVSSSKSKLKQSDSESSLSIPPGQHDYTLCPKPSQVRLTGSSLWKQVKRNSSSSFSVGEADPSFEEEDLETCQENMLSHVLALQDDLAAKMDLLEQQVTEQEEAALLKTSHDPLSDLPQVKKSLQTLLRDLEKVKRMSLFHTV